MPPAIAGPRERQLDAPEDAAAVEAQRARRLDQRRRALEERGPREQEHVRIEREDEHRRRALERADVRKPVVGARPSEGVAQRRLDGTRVLEEVGVRVGHHVRRHRERQQQRPREEPAARKAPARDEPAGGRAPDGHAGADERDEQQRVGDVARQHGAGKVHPRVAGAERHPAPHDRGDRQHRQRCGDGRERGEPAAAADHVRRAPVGARQSRPAASIASRMRPL